MSSRLSQILLTSKHLLTQTPLPQILLYVLAKVCFFLMQMPHQKKQLTYIPFLLTNIIFLLSAIGLKIYRHRWTLLRKIVKMQGQCFLLWVINDIMMVFSWSLLSGLEWGIFQILLAMASEFLSVFVITLLTDQQFMSKMEFVGYQLILGVQIIGVSMKTVGFIKHNIDSPHKDIVLLNLTTQIALMIILMDFIQKSYSRWKKLQITENMNKFENQMVIIGNQNQTGNTNANGNKMSNEARSQLRDKLELRE